MSLAKPTYLQTMLELLLLGAKDKPVELSTIDLAKRIGKSQQAASKHLLELEQNGYIERTKAGKRTLVKLTKLGNDVLLQIHLQLKTALEGKPQKSEVNGTVFTGLGEGAYYISLNGYRKQFVKKLGFDPYLGTLNLRLTSPLDRMVRDTLEKLPGIKIEGFEDGHRTYGGAKCFTARLNDSVHGAVLVLERTSHDNSVLEVIAPVRLRDKLNLKDGDPVKVSIDAAI
jgi:riboflavin kinase